MNDKLMLARAKRLQEAGDGRFQLCEHSLTFWALIDHVRHITVDNEGSITKFETSGRPTTIVNLGREEVMYAFWGGLYVNLHPRDATCFLESMADQVVLHFENLEKV